jgi:protein required for attachment to host cells
MILPHKTEICVADGRKFLLLVNEGDAVYPDLEVIHAEAQENPRDRDQGSAPPGRVSQSVGPRNSAYDETDFHQLSEERFAADVAEILRKRALAGRFEKLVVVAPPRTLGEMRQHYHKEVASRIVGEIAKEATNRPPDEIGAMIQSA